MKRKMKKTMTKTGKDNEGMGITNPLPFTYIYGLQQSFQKKVTGVDTPADSLRWYQYHVIAMSEELGEVLKSDKRWKTHRNENYEPENKLEELADIFITAMNISMYSGFSAEQIEKAILNKIGENLVKLENSRKEG